MQTNAIEEKIIKKGDKAPFAGVLTPEIRWRMREEELAMCDLFKDRVEPADEYEKSSEWTMFFVGMATGSLAAIALTGLSQK